MPTSDRRQFLALGAAAAFLGIPPARLAALKPPAAAPLPTGLEHFPRQDPAMVRQCVGVAHGRFEQLRELVEAHPALATASIDWGYGDWETPIGAASHVGSREIAEYLLTRGARPNIFSAAMLGQLDVVRAFVAANPGVQRTPGPHGITLLNHARAGGPRATEVLSYLESLGDANPSLPLVPLAVEDYARYLGTYRFGGAPDEEIHVTETRQMLQVWREVGGNKTVFHMGNHQFRPGGAPAVRIIFDVQADQAASLTVIDREPVLTAQRVAS
jgi:hypothetical protein